MTYQEKKENIRAEAIEWQRTFSAFDYNYYDLLNWQIYFYKMGKRYGLLKEFRENGIS